jgi:sigma-E factor negative regulatory protein RseC
VETEEGIVIRVEAQTAWVKTQQSGACQGCSARGACHGLGGGGQEREVIVVNEAGAKVGDRILLSLQSSSLLKVSFLLYLFPVLALMAGAIVGQQFGSVMGLGESAGAALAGFCALILALGFVKTKANELAQRNEYRPKVIRILERC